MQSNNACCHYKNKHIRGILQKLANEFILQMICTWDAAEHWKSVSDEMSIFSEKNI